MANNYTINYEDEQFKQNQNELNNQIKNNNELYNNMINQNDNLINEHKNMLDDWQKKQTELQNKNTEQTINLINQNKDDLTKDYKKEQAAAYVDWQKQSNRYGANAEQMASNGLRNTGYSESNQTSMYNTYQSRVGIARESFNKGIREYDNQITQARLANDTELATIAYNALKEKLNLSLEGLKYRNSLLLDLANKNQELNNTYYQRRKDIINQMNYENDVKENIRQYNEKMKYQKQRDKIADQQWQKEYNLAVQKQAASKGSNKATIKNTNANTKRPTSINGVKVTSTGNTITVNGKEYDVYMTASTNSTFGGNTTLTKTQYYWNGSKYVKIDSSKKNYKPGDKLVD